MKVLLGLSLGFDELYFFLGKLLLELLVLLKDYGLLLHQFLFELLLQTAPLLRALSLDLLLGLEQLLNLAFLLGLLFRKLFFKLDLRFDQINDPLLLSGLEGL